MSEISFILADGRAEAEAIMTAVCVVRRKVGESRDGIKITPIYDIVYGPNSPKGGICKPQTFRPQESQVGHLSGAIRTVTRSEIHFPIGEFVAVVGDVVTIIASENNPLIVGLHFRVVDDDLVTEHPTAYHVPVTRDAEAVMPPLIP